VSSAVEACRLCIDERGCGAGVGRVRSNSERSGSISSMNSGSAGAANGERKGWQSAWRARVWEDKCEVRAVCAVMSLLAPFSTPACDPRSLRASATLCTTLSPSLPLASAPRRARLSTAAIRASSEGEMPSTPCKSLWSP